MQQEVRFALVLYGGVSLAVYMNGVTQEFFHLVRATSENASGEATGTEAVYRDLAAMANSRFAVDIVSGSSAGGINAIFLGKALANGQDLDGLSRLWMEEAVVESCCGTSHGFRAACLSGRNNVRDAAARAGWTWTMAAVRPAAIRKWTFSSPRPIFKVWNFRLILRISRWLEKRHKNVFHFAFGGSQKRRFCARGRIRSLPSPARATSSFPVAFEPARLADYDASRKPREFFPDYVAAGADYARRAFGDGGYLNNKPFNYALGTDSPPHQRSAGAAHAGLYRADAGAGRRQLDASAPPGPIRNSIEALITLHQYETIREDLAAGARSQSD